MKKIIVISTKGFPGNTGYVFPQEDVVRMERKTDEEGDLSVKIYLKTGMEEIDWVTKVSELEIDETKYEYMAWSKGYFNKSSGTPFYEDHEYRSPQGGAETDLG